MGGFGSTRWKAHRKKVAVEDCITLPISSVNACVAPGQKTLGHWLWDNSLDGFLFVADYELISTVNDRGELKLKYRIAGDEIHDTILLETTHPYWGGLIGVAFGGGLLARSATGV